MYTLLNRDLVDALFECDSIFSINFNDINSLITEPAIENLCGEAATIVCVLNCMRTNFASAKLHGRNEIINTINCTRPNLKADQVTISDVLIANIVMLFSHSDIDFTIESNVSTLSLFMIENDDICLGCEILDKILERHRLNPDFIVGENSVNKCLKLRSESGIYEDDIFNRVTILIKHGADVNFGADKHNIHRLPYMYADFSEKLFQLILSHTNKFYCLEYVFHFLDDHYSKKIFEHILRYGKISSLKYLGLTDTAKIKAYSRRLKNISGSNALEYYDTLANYFEITTHGIEINRILRKLCVFKRNVECLVRKPINVPAYQFYDIAITFLFLINHQHLTVLTSDILRHIALFVFS